MKLVKNYAILILLGLAVFATTSCTNDKAASNKKARTEMKAKKGKKKGNKNVKKQAGKKASKGKKYWPTAKRKFDLTASEVKQLKKETQDFNKKKKAIRDKKMNADRNKVIQNHYDNVKKIIGEEKGQNYITWSRKFNKRKNKK